MFEQLLKISEFFLNNQTIDTSEMTILYEMEKDNYEIFEKDLYVRKNGNLKNFTQNEEIILNLNGINFLFRKKV